MGQCFQVLTVLYPTFTCFGFEVVVQILLEAGYEQ